MTTPFNDQTPRDDGTAIQLGPERASRRLVLLHGWGADADDLLDLGLELLPLTGLSAAEQAQISLVALRAPLPHPGGIGRQWYDLQQPEWPQLAPARVQLRARLIALGASVPLQRTALLGFSQGAAMALDVATGGGGEDADAGGATGDGRVGAQQDHGRPARGALPLAALIACSGYPHPGWQPLPLELEPNQAPTTKFLLTHGEQDPVVPFAASVELERLLQTTGRPVQRLGFSGGHGIDPALLGAMGAFLAAGWQQAADADPAAES